MKRTQIATVALTLAAGVPCAGAQLPAAEAGEELELVTVTGSRIRTVRSEGPSPVSVITAEDIARRGYSTVQEAVNSLTQVTGTPQTEAQPGSFTQNANAFDLRGVGPGRTLVLVDGRRVADYPMPYDGESNFVNLSAIPVAAVERVELLASGASAIYGSDAVAGVLNIVLKQRVDTPLTFEVRGGDTTQGGGESVRVQGVTGGNFGRLGVLVAAELFDRKPIYAFQRDFQDSVLDNPAAAARINTRSLLRMDPFDWDEDGLRYIDPTAAACEPFAQTLEYSQRAGQGFYCGQDDALSQFTLRNARRRASAFGRLTYDLGGGMELAATLGLHGSRDRFDSNFNWFSTEQMVPGATGYLFDVSQDPDDIGGNFALLQRYFQPWEIGGYRVRQDRTDEKLADYSISLRGDLGSSDWRYDLTLGGSDYDVQWRRPLLLSQALMDYFLGPQLRDSAGELRYEDISGFDLPMYAVDWQRFYSPVNPQTYQSLIRLDEQQASSSNKVATMVLSGGLTDLPAGRLDGALVLEAARQSYDIDLTDALQDGDYFGQVGTGGGGHRKRYAIGGELRVPLLQSVALQLAGRYDHYDDITDVDGAFSYNAGLEVRPLRQLLLRGNYATSFRAPDMHYVFSDPSGFFTAVTDEYLCRRDEPGVPLAACETLSGGSVEGARQGNPALNEEKGRSFGFGLVAEAAPGLVLSADYYDIRIRGGVKDDSLARVLQTEADCRLGQTRTGTPVATDSALCDAAIARVQRRPADGGAQSEFLDLLIVGPINRAMNRTSGIDAALAYSFAPLPALGRFTATAAYTQVLKNDLQEFSDDDVVNLLNDRAATDWHSRISGTLGWTRGPLTGTLHLQRYGSIWNWAETERLPDYLLTNLSARYSGLFGGSTYVGLAVQNLFDRGPPRDGTFDVYPYYSTFNYSPTGREMFVEVGARF